VQYCRAVVRGRILQSLGGLPDVASTHLQGWLRRQSTGARFQVRRGGAAHRFFGSPGYGAPRHRARSRQAEFFASATVSRRLVLFERAVIDGDQDDDARPRVPRPAPECVVELRFRNGGRVVERGFLSGDLVEYDDPYGIWWTYIVGMPITGDAARARCFLKVVDRASPAVPVPSRSGSKKQKKQKQKQKQQPKKQNEEVAEAAAVEALFLKQKKNLKKKFGMEE
jgi:hypothetical protein